MHNHPSGDPQPSNQDIEITKRLVEVKKLIGINVLDHVVIGQVVGCFFRGRMKKSKARESGKSHQQALAVSSSLMGLIGQQRVDAED